MDQDEIPERVIRVIAEQFGLNEIDVTPEKHIANDLGADSLDAIEIAMEIEEEFSIEIPDASAESCKSVADLICLVESVISAAKQGATT